jgi:hypothetical protein
MEKACAEGVILGKTLFHLQGIAFADGKENAVEALCLIASRKDDAPRQADIRHDALQFARGVKDDVPLPPKCAV